MISGGSMCVRVFVFEQFVYLEGPKIIFKILLPCKFSHLLLFDTVFRINAKQCRYLH